MAIDNTITRNQYSATASQTVFAYTFEIADEDDIKVEQNGTVLSKTTHYTVSGVAVDTGGNITLVTGATSGDVITIYRDMDFDRESDYQQNGSFTAAEINTDLDRLWMAVQQTDTNLGSAIRPSITDSVLNSTNTELANVATRAGKVLGFDATGLLNYTSSAIPSGDFVDVTTTAVMAALAAPSVGDVVQTAEFSTGNGGGGTYDCVTVGTTPNVDFPNTYNIIVSTADITKCFVLRPGSVIDYDLTLLIPTNHTTIQDAVDTWQQTTCEGDFNIILQIEAGHALTAGLGVFSGDYGHFKITSVDATVSLDAGFVGVDTSSVPAGILALGIGSLAPLFFGYNAVFPQLDCVIDMGNLYGTGYYLAESSGVVFPAKGVINAGYRGAQIHGRCNMYAADFSGANGSGLRIQQASSVCARNAIFDDCCVTSDDAAVYVSRASILEFRGGSAQNSGTSGLIARRSRVSADEGNFDGSTLYGISAETNSDVSWSNGSALSCANHSARSTAGSHLYMVGSATSTSTSVSNLDINTGGRIDLAASNTIEGVSSSEANVIAETDGISWLNSFGNNGMVFYNDSTTENYPLLTSSAGITADVGSAQGGSPLTSKFNRVSVCANVGDSLTMPDAGEGREVIIVNDGANACDVFPASGDRLDSAATDVAVSLAAGGRITYIAYNTARWVSV